MGQILLAPFRVSSQEPERTRQAAWAAGPGIAGSDVPPSERRLCHLLRVAGLKAPNIVGRQVSSGTASVAGPRSAGRYWAARRNGLGVHRRRCREYCDR